MTYLWADVWLSTMSNNSWNTSQRPSPEKEVGRRNSPDVVLRSWNTNWFFENVPLLENCSRKIHNNWSRCLWRSLFIHVIFGLSSDNWTGSCNLEDVLLIIQEAYSVLFLKKGFTWDSPFFRTEYCLLDDGWSVFKVTRTNPVARTHLNNFSIFNPLKITEPTYMCHVWYIHFIYLFIYFHSFEIQE